MQTDKGILSDTIAQLAIDLNCSTGDFSRKGIVFCEAKENRDRRPFPRGERHFDMVTMGSSAVVSATTNILPYLREQLEGKTRDEAFDMPFVCGQGIFYLPGINAIAPVPAPSGYDIVVEARNIHKLYAHKGFPHAIWYKPHHRPETIVAIAYKDGVAAGMAGASDDCAMLWQIGVDVLPEHQRKGIAAALTSQLAIEILKLGKIPYYGTGTSNIASQRVALVSANTLFDE
jgi:hypothetical protein